MLPDLFFSGSGLQKLLNIFSTMVSEMPLPSGVSKRTDQASASRGAH
jgi:hypothetical protein